MTGSSSIISARESGVSLVEILVSLIVVLIGLLGLISLQGRAQQAEIESYQRTQALVLLQDAIDRLNTHRKAASCMAVTTASTGQPFLGATGTGHAGTVACASSPGTSDANAIAVAVASINEWNTVLTGAVERAGATAVGGITGARGCIGVDLRNLAAVPPRLADTYTIAVAWQGLVDTVAPAPPAPVAGETPVPGRDNAIACASGLYGTAAKRRVVWTSVQIANL